MPDLGVRLQLLIGPEIPAPAPFALVDALAELTVQSNDRERDGFQLTFTLGKQPQGDYNLLRLGLLAPPARVMIIVLINARPQILIDGVITNHQLRASNQPGQSTLTVTGEDISFQMDREEKRLTHRNLSDSQIVTQIVSSYGLVPEVTATDDVPIEARRVPSQHGTDLAYVRELARRNGFVFYVEPTELPGVCQAYWGPTKRQGQAQPPLTMNMGPHTNVDQPIAFQYDALAPAEAHVRVLDGEARRAIDVARPSGDLPALASQVARPLRKILPPSTARLSTALGSLRMQAENSQAADAITATGEVDAVRYGRVLRSRGLVSVRGAGQAYNGVYYVAQVTHQIRRGEYRQRFTLRREGLGAKSSAVAT